MFAQAFFWRNLLIETQNGKKYTILPFIPFLFLITGLAIVPFFFGSVIAPPENPLIEAPGILSRADLATLPESARDIHVCTYRPIGYAADYLRFQADTNDIEKFIAKSPGLKNAEIFTSSRYTQINEFPSWYNHKTENIRSYRYNDDSYHIKDRYIRSWKTELIVDDEAHNVYLFNCIHR